MLDSLAFHHHRLDLVLRLHALFLAKKRFPFVSVQIPFQLVVFCGNIPMFFRVWNNAIVLLSKSCVGCRIQVSFLVTRRTALIAKASSVADGVVSNASASPIPPSGSNDESIAVDKTPSGSKHQLQFEQK